MLADMMDIYRPEEVRCEPMPVAPVAPAQRPPALPPVRIVEPSDLQLAPPTQRQPAPKDKGKGKGKALQLFPEEDEDDEDDPNITPFCAAPPPRGPRDPDDPGEGGGSGQGRKRDREFDLNDFPYDVDLDVTPECGGAGGSGAGGGGKQTMYSQMDVWDVPPSADSSIWGKMPTVGLEPVFWGLTLICFETLAYRVGAPSK
jgi:hypothetical protein